MSILNPFKKDKKGAAKSADEPAVEPPVSSGGAVPSIPRERQDRQRGPVEEVIAKRMRQLGKKLQRYRSYAAQSPESLNDDQRSAIKALPSLEGAYRELEELIRENGPVDEQELIQAAKLREATEAARSAAAQESSQGLESYKSSLVTPLSLFLRLHSLLHPARSADHEHLTFGHLTLPARLQDEVQATDVLRVGRMWEDLAAGGDAGKAVLEGLVSGPDSTDNDDEHVHHLLKLLSQPENQEVESESAPVETAPAQVDEPTESAPVAPTEVIQPESIAASRAQSEYGQQESTDSTKPASTSGGVLNFLQDDELNSEQKEEKSLGESYEIVPRLEAHQTSGSQPPIPAETETATTSEAPAAAPVTESIATQAPTQNWADLDDEDGVPPAASSDIPVLAQPIAVAEDNTGAPGQTGARGTGPRGRGRNNGPRPPRQGQQQRDQAESGEPTIDADGFEVKSGRKGLPPPPSSRGSFRGRGRGGPRGGGRPAGERAASSNGPAGAEGQSAPSTRGPRPPARGGSSSRGGRGGSQTAQAPVTEKKSIYKTVQPTGPASAPIL